MAAPARLDLQKSTIVRSGIAPRVVRLAFGALEHAAPALGARWAERIWFTLPAADRRPRPRPRTDGPPPGRPFAVQVAGHRINGEDWGDGPAVYLVHGWAGFRAQLSPFVLPMVERGYRVVAFDFPSHGESAPGAFGARSSSIAEFAESLRAVVDACGPAHAVIAHSMGCAAAAVALRGGLTTTRVAMLAPAARPSSYGHQLAGTLGFGARTYRRLIARVEDRVGFPMSHFDVPEIARAVAVPPTLVVHDRTDTSTPVSDGGAIAAAWPGARLHLTTGLGHRRLLRDPEVVSLVAAFIDR